MCMWCGDMVYGDVIKAPVQTGHACLLLGVYRDASRCCWAQGSPLFLSMAMPYLCTVAFLVKVARSVKNPLKKEVKRYAEIWGGIGGQVCPPHSWPLISQKISFYLLFLISPHIILSSLCALLSGSVLFILPSLPCILFLFLQYRSWACIFVSLCLTLLHLLCVHWEGAHWEIPREAGFVPSSESRGIKFLAQSLLHVSSF